MALHYYHILLSPAISLKYHTNQAPPPPPPTLPWWRHLLDFTSPISFFFLSFFLLQKATTERSGCDCDKPRIQVPAGWTRLQFLSQDCPACHCQESGPCCCCCCCPSPIAFLDQSSCIHHSMILLLAAAAAPSTSLVLLWIDLLCHMYGADSSSWPVV